MVADTHTLTHTHTHNDTKTLRHSDTHTHTHMHTLHTHSHTHTHTIVITIWFGYWGREEGGGGGFHSDPHPLTIDSSEWIVCIPPAPPTHMFSTQICLLLNIFTDCVCLWLKQKPATQNTTHTTTQTPPPPPNNSFSKHVCVY
jgi:hypothetical protein